MSAFRIDRLLANIGLGTRAQVQCILRQRRVSVNGVMASDPSMHVSEADLICIDGIVIDTRLRRHLMMNKPSGVLTAATDNKQKTVLDLLPCLYKSCGCMPVGRLDKDTEGLLLFTTDGQLAHRLISPGRGIWKVYEAVVSGELNAGDAAAFAQGLQLSDFKTLPAELQILSADTKYSAARVSVCEGKFHQVKRMFLSRGKEVTRLKRTSFGPVVLDESLLPGEYRELTAEEYQALLHASGG